MPGCPRRHPARRVHPRLEVAEALLGDLDVGARDGAGVLLDRVEENDEFPRALVEDPEESPPIVAAQFAKLALDLGGVRERQGRSRRW